MVADKKKQDWPNLDVAKMSAEFRPPQSLNHVPQRYKIKERLPRPHGNATLAVVLRESRIGGDF